VNALADPCERAPTHTATVVGDRAQAALEMCEETSRRERKESTGGTCVPPVCVSLRYDALCQMPNTAPVGSWMIAKRPIFGTSIGSLRIVAPNSFARATVASASCVAT
jgi:hypothetical protein